jgi:DUF1680 family protein
MYAGMVDVAALTGDQAYIQAINRLWDNVVGKKLYLTGGIGATGSNEGFSKNYELPNMSAYNETCSSIGNVYWNHRLFLLHGKAKYFDLLERTLYNALLSGISLEGTRFFYPNPLESVGQHQRSSWFGCACCPGNVTRFMASVPGYVYAKRGNHLYVNLYASNRARIELQSGKVMIAQHTHYPWEGKIRIQVNPEIEPMRFTLNLRIPGWSQGKPVASDLYRYINDDPVEVTLLVNNKTVSLKQKNGYAIVSRTWKRGDVVDLDLPMKIRRVVAHDSVTADHGRVALERGPLVFCAEWPDNQNGHVRNLRLPDETELNSTFRSDLLKGVQIISGKGFGYNLNDKGDTSRTEQTLFFIPYYAWAHRGKGEMAVWLAREEKAVRPIGHPTLASLSQVTASYGKNPQAVNDLLEPESSIDHNVPFFHWWPHKGSTEWIQYSFSKPEEISIVEVYWFDDTGIGECRLPNSWRILIREGTDWKPVYTTDLYGIKGDRYNKVVFETVKTTAVRLEVQSQDGWAGGIHEWKVK